MLFDRGFSSRLVKGLIEDCEVERRSNSSSSLLLLALKVVKNCNEHVSKFLEITVPNKLESRNSMTLEQKVLLKKNLEKEIEEKKKHFEDFKGYMNLLLKVVDELSVSQI